MTTPNTADRKPSKPWRVTLTTAPVETTFAYSSETKAYLALNQRTAELAAKAGDTFDVHRWEGGRWVLYERGVFTENSWEPA